MRLLVPVLLFFVLLALMMSGCTTQTTTIITTTSLPPTTTATTTTATTTFMFFDGAEDYVLGNHPSVNWTLGCSKHKGDTNVYVTDDLSSLHGKEFRSTIFGCAINSFSPLESGSATIFVVIDHFNQHGEVSFRFAIETNNGNETLASISIGDNDELKYSNGTLYYPNIPISWGTLYNLTYVWDGPHHVFSVYLNEQLVVEDIPWKNTSASNVDTIKLFTARVDDYYSDNLIYWDNVTIKGILATSAITTTYTTTTSTTTTTACPDSDDDGWDDCYEVLAGTNPYIKDTDNDGIIDSEDLSPLLPATTTQASNVGILLTLLGLVGAVLYLAHKRK